MVTRLVGDIGGTNARFAWVGASGRPQGSETLAVCDYPGIAEAISAFAGDRPIAEACIAVACPAHDDIIRFTNSPWQFSQRGLKERFGLDRLVVVNDFTALALSVPGLGDGEIERIGGGDTISGAPIAVIGPGTGLGVSGLVQRNGQWAALSGEGGHVGFAPADEEEIEILKVLAKRFGRVSVERLLSGSGLKNLYDALCEIEGTAGIAEDAAAISRLGLAGEDPAAVAAIERFCLILGSVAGDLALTLVARGGAYIGGGMAPRFLDVLRSGGFRRRFEDKGRFRDLMSSIPTSVITAENPALIGAAEHLVHG